MADDLKGPPLPKLGPQLEADREALDAEAKALGTLDRAIESNIRNTQLWGRARQQAAKDQETLIQALKSEKAALVQSTKEFLSFNRQIHSAGGAVQGFIRNLSDATSVSRVYNNLLGEMRQGQKAYTQTLQATTNNIATASATSQKYINAVHDAYANAHKIAGEFRVQEQELMRAADQLTERFGSQLGAMGDVSGALKSMQREALILSRYLGTDMGGVMDMWQEQLEQTIGTLDDARGEVILIARETDKYAQGLQKLGDSFMKTGNIGKREFVDMIRSLGKSLRTGTIDASAYASALRGLLIEGKKSLLTMNEQRAVAEASQRMMGDIFKMGSQLSYFGTQAAKKIISQWDNLGNIQNEQLRKRLETVRERFADAPEVQQIRAVMNVLQGSAAGSAEALKQIASSAGIEVSRELMAKYTEGNINLADLLARQVQSGELQANFEKKADEEAKEQRGEQVEVWKRSIEDLVKAGATPTETQYKMVAQLEDIRQTLLGIARNFPLYMIGGQIGGAVIGRLFKGVGGKLLGRIAGRRLATAGVEIAAKKGATNILGRTLGGAGTKLLGGAAAPTTVATGARVAGMGGRLAGVAGRAGTFVGGRVVPVVGAALLGWEIGSAVAKADIGGIVSKETKRILGKETTVADLISHKLLSWDDPRYKALTENITRLRGGEVQRRKKLVKKLDREIKDRESWGDQLDSVQKAELDALKRKKNAVETSIKTITKEEKESVTRTDLERSAKRQTATIMRLRELKLTGKEAPEEAAKKFLAGPQFQNVLPFMSKGYGQELTNILAQHPEKFGGKDPKKFIAAVRAGIAERALGERGFGVETKGMTKEEMLTEYLKRVGGKREIRSMTGQEVAEQRYGTFEKAVQSLKIDLTTDEGNQPVAVNAQGMLEFNTGQKMKIDGSSLLAALLKVAQLNNTGMPR